MLAAVRVSRVAADREEARLLGLAVAWAGMPSVDSIEDAAVLGRSWSGDAAGPAAGPGAPRGAEFCVAEFAVAVGLLTEVGRAFLGDAVELRYRLPRTLAQVAAGDLAA